MQQVRTKSLLWRRFVAIGRVLTATPYEPSAAASPRRHKARASARPRANGLLARAIVQNLRLRGNVSSLLVLVKRFTNYTPTVSIVRDKNK